MVRLCANILWTHVCVRLDCDGNDRVAQGKIYVAPLIGSCRNLACLQKCDTACVVLCRRGGL